jgi:hypothetical protein
MLETQQTLFDEIQGLLGALRCMGGGRYACLVEPGGLLLEDAAEPEEDAWVLRRFVEQRIPRLFDIPKALEGDGPAEDLFEDWDADEFFLAFINGKVGVLVACPDAAALEAEAQRPLKALADRLFRVNAAWRVDERGNGLLFGRARLDMVVIGRAEADGPRAEAEPPSDR